MKMLHHLFCLTLITIAMLQGITDKAEAVPAYARKYGEKCSLCHSVWPRLNRRGEDFKLNGYQLLRTADGDIKGKTQLGENSFLDTGDANPPVSAELQIEIIVDKNKKTRGSANDSRRTLLGGSAMLSLYASSTLNKNISWFAKYDVGNDRYKKDEYKSASLKQGFLTINNLDTHKIFNIEAGISNLNQHSVLTYHRNALSFLKTPQFGNLLYPDGDSPTIQIFGTPDGGVFTYSLGITDNSGNTDNELTPGGMLRLDFRQTGLAVSYNYLGGRNRGITGFTGNLGGAAFNNSSANVHTNRFNTHLLAVRKEWNFISQRAWIGYSSEDNFLHNIPGNAVKRDQLGYGTDIWIYADRVELGAGLDLFKQKAQKNVLWTDAKGTPQKNLRYLKIALTLNYLLSESSKIGLSYQVGGFEDKYLRATDMFNENSFLLSVDLTI